MSVAEGEAQVPAMASETAPPAEVSKPAAEKSSKPAKEKKARAPKAAKEKKPRAAKAPGSPSHPAYFQMIKEAILALKEKSGSSPHAIAKHMEEKYKTVLPANYRKMLTLQLRNCVAKGKLVKVKGSFKLSETGKKIVSAKKVVASEKKAKAPAAVAPKPKGKTDVQKKKRKAPSTPAKPKAAKSAKVSVKKVKKATLAKPKQPKSIKSPAAKRARRVAAA